MKIGITTWFEDENYGTCLQAVALFKYLKSRCCNVKIINFNADDFRNTFIIDEKKHLLKDLVRKCVYLIIKVLFNKSLKKRTIRFKSILDEHCTFTQLIRNESDYCFVCNDFDLLVYGSDQIWSPLCFHHIWFGDYSTINTPKISYAPSLGTGFIEKSFFDKYAMSLSGFTAVSVREQKSADMLEMLTNKKIPVVLDPTFLISIDEWRDISKESKLEPGHPYVMCYFLKDNPKHYLAVKRFAELNNHKIIIIPYKALSYFKVKNIKLGVGPKEFINLIDNADYVFTDSYHGTIFSIIFKKQFFTFERFQGSTMNNQNERVYDLLDRFRLKNRLIAYNSQNIKNNENIDYDLIQPLIDKEISFSKEFINKALEKSKKV